jgi:hypothetical protein
MVVPGNTSAKVTSVQFANGREVPGPYSFAHSTIEWAAAHRVSWIVGG